MSKKGGKGDKGKKGKEVVEEETLGDKEKIVEVERTFYELTIADIRKKIIRLRTHIQNLYVANDAAIEELRAIHEDKSDEAGELSHNVDTIYENIIELKTENAKMTVDYETAKRKAEETITDSENKYKAMHDQLSAEIKRLNGKLNSCEDFHFNQDIWMLKLSERGDEIVEKENEAREVIRKKEAQSAYDREMVKDEMLEHLTLAGEEFTGSGSTSSSNFNLRLIRENIALEKNIAMLIKSNTSMDDKIVSETKLYQDNRFEIPKLEKRNSSLILESQDKLELIKKLSEQVNQLKQEYIATLSYRNQNVSIKEFQMCARFRRKKQKKLVQTVGLQLNSMEREMNLYDYLIDQYDLERTRIAQHLEEVRQTVECAINVADEKSSISSSITFSEEEEEEEIKKNVHERTNLLKILAEMLKIDFDAFDPNRTSSIATISRYEKLTRFDELFKQEVPSVSSLMDMCVAYIESEADQESIESSEVTVARAGMMREYETYTPEARALGRNYIFDVESGTSLYYSSELDDPEKMQVEEQAAAADGEEEASSESSSSVDKVSDAETKTTATAATAATTAADAKPTVESPKQMPPGTIVDVVTEEEDEEEVPHHVEDAEEDEEYDINLFY